MSQQLQSQANSTAFEQWSVPARPRRLQPGMRVVIRLGGLQGLEATCLGTREAGSVVLKVDGWPPGVVVKANRSAIDRLLG